MTLGDWRRLATAILAILWMSSLALAQGAAVAPATDPLVDVNAASRAQYARAKADALAKLGPVIVVYEGDQVALIRDGKREQSRFVPDSDAALKSVAHVPLGVFTALDPDCDTPVSEQRLAELRAFREKIVAARGALDNRGFTPSTLERQYRILDESTAALDRVLADRQIRRSDVTAFTRRMAPLVLDNTAEAARAQIDGLHRQVSAWRAVMSVDEWRRVRVVVIGVHMARDGELATQYFLRLLGEAAEGDRVVYAEEKWDEAQAMDLVGKHILDSRLGESFFGSGPRMHRDILGDAARAYLDVLGIDDAGSKDR